MQVKIPQVVQTKLDELLDRASRPFVVAVDGPCGGGKSTLASRIAEQYGCGVVRMDNFFLPIDERKEGKHMDFARLRGEVGAILSGASKSYRAYSCKTREYSVVEVSPLPFLLIEGSYSLHPEVGLDYDLLIFVQVEREVQLKRLLVREGEEGLARFCSMWMPREDAYFEKYALPNADCLVVEMK